MKRILMMLAAMVLMAGMAGSAETVYQEIPLPVYAQPTFYTCTCLLYTSDAADD